MDLRDVIESNIVLKKRLRPFLIRHRHNRQYRRYFVGARTPEKPGDSSEHFSWRPGLPLPESAELIQYMLMRTVSLAKDERGRAGLGAEVTGSFRHLTQTSAAWRKLQNSKNPAITAYHNLLEENLSHDDADKQHPKIRETARRALAAFKSGQKTLIFCVFLKTAEAVRDVIHEEISQYIAEQRKTLYNFETDKEFEGFRKRFFNRHESLYSLIQDHPLLCGAKGIELPASLRLNEQDLSQVAHLLEERRIPFNQKQPDRRAILAAIEHVAVNNWTLSDEGNAHLSHVFANCADLREKMESLSWVPKRSGLGHVLVKDTSTDGLTDIENERSSGSRGITAEEWRSRLVSGMAYEVLVPYFAPGIIKFRHDDAVLPLLPFYHGGTLQKLDPETRSAAGQVFRRILMAEEFLTRYLANATREGRWAKYLSEQYIRRAEGMGESLQDRVQTYLETLERSAGVDIALQGYRDAAINKNIVQLVTGGDKKYRDRYFLGFNTPYRPEILITTSVGQEGIDLHKECRNVIHHDLCWNPATIEQRTGRVDRIGSKVEREIAKKTPEATPTLDIHAPYLAASYDERMFEELYRRAQMFEVTMGGDFEVENREEGKEPMEKELKRKGIGAIGEDLGQSGNSGVLDLPPSLVGKVRVDLSVWKPHQKTFCESVKKEESGD